LDLNSIFEVGEIRDAITKYQISKMTKPFYRLLLSESALQSSRTLSTADRAFFDDRCKELGEGDRRWLFKPKETIGLLVEGGLTDLKKLAKFNVEETPLWPRDGEK
jgi:hypothetical protein